MGGREERFDGCVVLSKYYRVSIRILIEYGQTRTMCLRRVEKSSIFSAKRLRGSVIPDSRYPNP